MHDAGLMESLEAQLQAMPEPTLPMTYGERLVNRSRRIADGNKDAQIGSLETTVLSLASALDLCVQTIDDYLGDESNRDSQTEYEDMLLARIRGREALEGRVQRCPIASE